jgi:hydrogenase-4 component F
MIIKYFIATFIILLGILISKNKFFTSVFTGIFLAIQLIFTVFAIIFCGKTDLSYFTYDYLGLIFLGILAILSIASYYHGLIYLKFEPVSNFNLYHIGFIALIASITGVYLSNNITLTWIFIEATTLSVATLIYHNRTIRALEATWKYVFICSTGIAIAYIGILFLSMTVKGIGENSMSYVNLSMVVKNADPLFLKLVSIFILIGYSAKLEIFPLYTIGIDANYVAPAPASAFISTALVNAGFVAVFRIYKVMLHSDIGLWLQHVMIILGILSLLVAAIYMQRVKNFKRLLAYSTVENMGIVLIGLGVGGYGIYAALLQVIIHSFVKSSMFYQFGQVHKVYKTYKISKTGGYMKLNPNGATVLLIGLIVLTAIPPSGLFVSEFLIFKSIIFSGNWFVFLAMALLLCFVIYGMSSKILQLIFTPMEKEIGSSIQISSVQSWSQYILLGFAIYLCFYRPGIFVEILSRAASLVL